MALPPEHRTPRIEALEAIVNRTPPEKRFEFPILEPADLHLIGFFIQQFNYMDFNLRRAIETFHYAKLLQGKAATKYPKIHSSEVTTAVLDAIKTMDANAEDIPEAIRILEIIERRREVRNMLGHWAARRIPNEDAIVLVTKNESDAMTISGAYLPNGHVKSAILDLPDIRYLVANELIPFELWLARKISEWRRRYVGD
jgi:hypothetical protein